MSVPTKSFWTFSHPRSKAFAQATAVAALVLASLIPAEIAHAQSPAARPTTPPAFFTFDELTTLSTSDRPQGPLKAKLSQWLTTPVVENSAAASGVRPHRPVGELGPALRVVFWNIERGEQLDTIRLAFENPDEFRKKVAEAGADASALGEIDRQARELNEADVIVLNEVDLGMKRTDYRNVTKELAGALKMNYVFGVEFVEVDRLVELGLEQVKLEDAEDARQMQEDLRPDPNQYRGLHGSAILSRYPIQNARIFRFPVCHDWFNDELKEISKIEKAKRTTVNAMFMERIDREVRLGGRMAILADLSIPDLPEGKATVVAAHLENKCKPGCRVTQMDALLKEIKGVANPVIMAGDMNTTGANGTPLSMKRLLLERVRNYEFWTKQMLKWFTPASLPLAVISPVKYFRNYQDPTAKHIPIVGGNSEGKLFSRIEKFRFTDKRAFDFRGNTERNRHGKGKTLANSNQRASKGFEPTFFMKRDYGGLVGRYKLDWFFVKSFATSPQDDDGSYRFSPHFSVTMSQFNNALPDGLSDHAPIAIDLPFQEPNAPASASQD